jgi:hypothetical protein
MSQPKYHRSRPFQPPLSPEQRAQKWRRPGHPKYPQPEPVAKEIREDPRQLRLADWPPSAPTELLP